MILPFFQGMGKLYLENKLSFVLQLAEKPVDFFPDFHFDLCFALPKCVLMLW